MIIGRQVNGSGRQAAEDDADAEEREPRQQRVGAVDERVEQQPAGDGRPG